MELNDLLTALENGLSSDWAAIPSCISTSFKHERWPLKLETENKKYDCIFGGEGYTILARDLRINNRKIVIKIAHGKLRRNPETFARFQRSIGLQSKIANVIKQGVPTVYEAGDYWFIMEYVPGMDSLAYCQKCDNDKIIIKLFCNLLAIVNLAHEFGIVHRDLKPDNILICKHPLSGELYVSLIDWGIAKDVIASATVDTTSTGEILGTVGYQSDIQKRDAGKASPKDDIYSLSRVLWSWLVRKKIEEETEPEMWFSEQVDLPIWAGVYEKARKKEYITCIQMSQELEKLYNMRTEEISELSASLIGIIKYFNKGK